MSYFQRGSMRYLEMKFFLNEYFWFWGTYILWWGWCTILCTISYMVCLRFLLSASTTFFVKSFQNVLWKNTNTWPRAANNSPHYVFHLSPRWLLHVAPRIIMLIESAKYLIYFLWKLSQFQQINAFPFPLKTREKLRISDAFRSKANLFFYVC